MGTMIDLTISSNVQDFQSIRRFPPEIKISELKNKLELLTGVLSDNMQLELRNNEDEFVSTLADDLATLEDNRARDGYHLRVQDISVTSLPGTTNGSANGNSEMLEDVPKFELTEEAYEQRSDSVRAWKQREKLGRFDPEAQKHHEQAEAKKRELAEKAAKNLKVGQRCEVHLPNAAPRRGTIQFVGKTKFKPGYWAGIKYDEPVGKNDGSIEGNRYFQCTPKYGGFCRPQDVIPGDFPEMTLDDMDEI